MAPARSDRDDQWPMFTRWAGYEVDPYGNMALEAAIFSIGPRKRSGAPMTARPGSTLERASDFVGYCYRAGQVA